MTRPKLLDLFCGAGGAARGYQLAGFHVTGVDINPQPRYAGDEFHQGDALTWPLAGFDAIHASPPCQHYAPVTRWRGRADNHADLIPHVRDRLQSSGAPWVIENVPGAPLRPDFMLCGGMFGINVQRHRWFETSWSGIRLILACHHQRAMLPFIHKRERAYADALGCDWMTNKEARDAVPPAYTEYIGAQLLDHLQAVAP